MARLFLSDVKDRPLVVSVEDSVGEGGANRRHDVLLIQFMLKVVNEKVGKFDWIKKRPAKALEIDGVYGNQTRDYIDLFQEQFTKLPVVRDKRVDPFVKGTWFGPRTYRLMTMAAINMAYIDAEGALAHLSMVAHPLFPLEIRPTLQISVKN